MCTYEDISKVKFDPKGFQNKADVVKFENINQGAIKVNYVLCRLRRIY
jgi:hypothetical protein